MQARQGGGGGDGTILRCASVIHSVAFGEGEALRWQGKVNSEL